MTTTLSGTKSPRRTINHFDSAHETGASEARSIFEQQVRDTILSHYFLDLFALLSWQWKSILVNLRLLLRDFGVALRGLAHTDEKRKAYAMQGWLSTRQLCV